MNNDEVVATEMQIALEAIANEMQRLHNESLKSNDSEICENEDILNKIMKYKFSLKSKKDEIKKLRQNLNTACFIAKTVTTAKENETNILNNHLNFARNQYLDLAQQKKDETDLINKLTTENQSLRDKLECFTHIIGLGYQELQKVRNEPLEDVSNLQQLKKIILCCGEYYAKYCNEHDVCVRLEQNNRFLNNKLRILEYSSMTSPDPIKSHNNYRKHKGTIAIRSDLGKPTECVDIGVVCSEYQMAKNRSRMSNVTVTKIGLNKNSIQMKSRDIDLSIHLDMVKKLLQDQDNLLNELKGLTKEINDLDSM